MSIQDQEYEHSTFMGGNDCQQCNQYEQEIDRLKKENEILKFIKADMDKIGEASYNFAKRMIDYDCENIKLKSRIDRAVEFISSLMDANEKHTISSQVIKILTEGVKCSGK